MGGKVICQGKVILTPSCAHGRIIPRHLWAGPIIPVRL